MNLVGTFTCCLFVCFFWAVPHLAFAAGNLTKIDSRTSRVDNDSFPVPTGNAKMLFYLQRTANTNTIICEINADSRGIPNPEKPVNVYWLLFTAGGARKELNYIQRNFAYGIDSKSIGNDVYELHFVSYKKRKFYLKWHVPLKKYQVFATINNKEAILQRIFVKVSGGSFWVPNIVYVEFRGIDPLTGKEVLERFKP